MVLIFKGAPHLPEYHSTNLDLHLAAGEITGELPDDVAATLKADFPGLFIDAQKPLPLTQDAPEAPVDRQIKKAESHLHKGKGRR